MFLSEVQKVAQFQQKRRRGDVTEIALNTGYSRSHASNVLAGRRNNPSITSAAYRMANRRLTNEQLVSRMANA